MATILDSILKTKRSEVAAARQVRSDASVRTAASAAASPRDFSSAVQRRYGDGINLIAEIKQRSPSAGVIVPEFDPVYIARTYERCGARALSVLTDATYFGGSLDILRRVKASVSLPILRKDFIIDEYQVYESRAEGADAILLIAEAIGAAEAARLASVARELGLGVLVEVHSAENLHAVVDRMGLPGEQYVLGINNRDLTAQRTSLSTCAALSKLLPAGTPFVAESGISSRPDVERLISVGASAMLIGESLLRASDMATKIDELLGRDPSGEPAT